MKIDKQHVNDVQKALVRSQANGFQLENQTELVQFGPVKPRLLTVLMGAMDQVNQRTFNTASFEYDELTRTAQLPSGKSYSERGKDLQKDPARVLRYSIGSKGLRLNVAPQDYVGRRKYGSATEFMTEADVLTELNIKNQEGWDLDMELGLREILVNDSNYTAGGPFPTYNYYTDIVGAARPAAFDVDMGNNPDVIVTMRRQRKLLLQEVEKAGLDATKVVCICGDTFFNARYELEKQETIARELRSSLDLVSMPVPTVSDGEFLYDNFESHDGILYINYGATIIGGTKLMPDDDARMFPVIQGDSLIKLGFAPAHHRDYVNTEALTMYSWQYVDDFQGVTAFYERNMLEVLQRPKLIVHLTTSTTP